MISKITPWEVPSKIDYGKLMKEFGLESFGKLLEQFIKYMLFRRKLLLG